MTDDTSIPATGRRRRAAWAVGLLAAGTIGGAALALSVPAWADPSTSPSPAASGSPSAQRPGQPGVGRPDGGQRPDETLLTGADADKAKAAALAAVPGGTVDRVETDADGAVYEAHMTKADGTKVTVKFDKNFTVTAIQDGMGSHA